MNLLIIRVYVMKSQWEGTITDADGDRDQGDATREGATYGLYARKDIVHKDTKTWCCQL